MNEHEMNTAVRAWLGQLPGTFSDGCSDGVVRKAWGAFGRGNLEMFRAALAMNGFRPEPLGRTFILRLPSKPTGSADWNRIARMTNVVG